jgi:hypothetical protein
VEERPEAVAVHEWLLEMTRRHHGPDEHTGAALMTMAQVGVLRLWCKGVNSCLHRDWAQGLALAGRARVLKVSGLCCHQLVILAVSRYQRGVCVCGCGAAGVPEVGAGCGCTGGRRAVHGHHAGAEPCCSFSNPITKRQTLARYPLMRLTARLLTISACISCASFAVLYVLKEPPDYGRAEGALLGEPLLMRCGLSCRGCMAGASRTPTFGRRWPRRARRCACFHTSCFLPFRRAHTVNGLSVVLTTIYGLYSHRGR